MKNNVQIYRKCPKIIARGLYFSAKALFEGLYTEGNLRFKVG